MALIVAYSNFKKPFILYMNVFKKDIRVVLYQKDDQDKECIIACISRTLNQYEKNYPIIEKECLAIV